MLCIKNTIYTYNLNKQDYYIRRYSDKELYKNVKGENLKRKLLTFTNPQENHKVMRWERTRSKASQDGFAQQKSNHILQPQGCINLLTEVQQERLKGDSQGGNYPPRTTKALRKPTPFP